VHGEREEEAAQDGAREMGKGFSTNPIHYFFLLLFFAFLGRTCGIWKFPG